MGSWYLASRILIAISMAISAASSDEMVLEYTVAEELPVQTFVGNVATDAGFDRKYSYLGNHTAELHQIFRIRCTWAWLGRLMVELRYVMYFRFSG